MVQMTQSFFVMLGCLSVRPYVIFLYLFRAGFIIAHCGVKLAF
jgi:hypothetical protein